MYPLCCHGGHPLPVVKGKYMVCGVKYAAEDSTANSIVVIVDDEEIGENDTTGRLLGPNQDEHDDYYATASKIIFWEDQICDTAKAGEMFPEPIKTRYGLSVYADNVKAGSLCVYVR